MLGYTAPLHLALAPDSTHQHEAEKGLPWHHISARQGSGFPEPQRSQ